MSDRGEDGLRGISRLSAAWLVALILGYAAFLFTGLALVEGIIPLARPGR